MSISKINNSFSFSSSQNPSPQDLRKLSDEELYFLASYDSDKRYSNVSKKSMKTMLFAIPLVDSIASGLVKKGNLSDKILKSSKTLGKWGAVFVAALAVFGIKRAVNNNSATLDNIDKEHRFLSLGIDLAAVYYTLTNALKLKDVAKKQFNAKFPKFTKNVKDFALTPLKGFINNSFINKKLVLSAERIASKKPHFVVSNKIVASLLAPVMAGAVLLRVHNEAQKRERNINNNYTALKGLNEMISQMQDTEGYSKY